MIQYERLSLSQAVGRHIYHVFAGSPPPPHDSVTSGHDVTRKEGEICRGKKGILGADAIGAMQLPKRRSNQRHSSETFSKCAADGHGLAVEA